MGGGRKWLAGVAAPNTQSPGFSHGIRSLNLDEFFPFPIFTSFPFLRNLMIVVVELKFSYVFRLQLTSAPEWNISVSCAE